MPAETSCVFTRPDSAAGHGVKRSSSACVTCRREQNDMEPLPRNGFRPHPQQIPPDFSDKSRNRSDADPVKVRL